MTMSSSTETNRKCKILTYNKTHIQILQVNNNITMKKLKFIADELIHELKMSKTMTTDFHNHSVMTFIKVELLQRDKATDKFLRQNK